MERALSQSFGEQRQEHKSGTQRAELSGGASSYRAARMTHGAQTRG